jgi:alginate O-acetyltransferase complex protein AlgI
MNVCSIEWVVCLLVFSGLFFLLPGIRPKQILLFACNISFVASLVPNTGGWIALAAFVGFGFLTAWLLRQFPHKIILVLYLVVVLSAFVLFKQYSFVKLVLPAAFFQKVIATVGWSYILFRQIQVAVDAYQGQIENLSLWNYLNFQLNVFGFIAGPIQRYQEFCRYWTELVPILPDAESVFRAYLRVFAGAIKITLLAGLFLSVVTTRSDILNDASLAGRESHGQRIVQLLELFYAFPLYIYFNFSGYCDMVIAGASLFGIKMPENFERPYLSRNMIDFWTRWHRTLGFWIRDYIFTPMYKAIASRWPARAGSLAFLCYFAAFFLAGVWHGSTWNFVVYGLLNGLGLAVTKLWENHLIKRRGRPGLRAYLQDPVVRVAAIAVTLNFACLTMFFFASDLGQTYRMIKMVLNAHI